MRTVILMMSKLAIPKVSQMVVALVLVDETLQAIEQTGASVNAFIAVAAEQVLDAARRC